MKCPKCREPVTAGAPNCTCGWRRKGGDAEDDWNHKRCRYRSGGERCPAPATLYDSITGMESGYCRWHFWVQGEQGYQIMKDLERNGIPRERDYIREEVEERAKDYARLPAEPVVDWRERIHVALDRALGKIERKTEQLQGDRK